MVLLKFTVFNETSRFKENTQVLSFYKPHYFRSMIEVLGKKNLPYVFISDVLLVNKTKETRKIRLPTLKLLGCAFLGRTVEAFPLKNHYSSKTRKIDTTCVKSVKAFIKNNGIMNRLFRF